MANTASYILVIKYKLIPGLQVYTWLYVVIQLLLNCVNLIFKLVEFLYLQSNISV